MEFGKREPKYDERTIMLSEFMDASFRAPSRYDFDKYRTEIPLNDWGSETQKCCVIASQANQLLRFGRVDQRMTLPLRKQDVVRRYKKIAGVEKAGDEKDIGLNVLSSLRYWHREGWNVQRKDYGIAAYGEIEPNEREFLRTAAYVLRGVHFGFWLPLAVANSFQNEAQWDYDGQTGDEWKPGSLGGTLAFSKAYDPSGFEVLAWGNTIKVSNDFIEKFCDEIWVVVENLDEYWVQVVLDTWKLQSRLELISKTKRREEG
jgi:hypothetical protein